MDLTYGNMLVSEIEEYTLHGRFIGSCYGLSDSGPHADVWLVLRGWFGVRQSALTAVRADGCRL